MSANNYRSLLRSLSLSLPFLIPRSFRLAARASLSLARSNSARQSTIHPSNIVDPSELMAQLAGAQFTDVNEIVSRVRTESLAPGFDFPATGGIEARRI